MFRIKVISFFLSLLIALQALPIEQIGRMLSTNQWTEELPHNSGEEAGKADFAKVIKDSYLISGIPGVGLLTSDNAGTIYIHVSSQIPSNHSTDVVSPPPDAQV